MVKVKPVPADMHTVTPHLLCNGAADAIDFYQNAFGAVELRRVPGPQGMLMHAEIRIGDSSIMLADDIAGCGASGPTAPNSSTMVIIHLYVEDVDTLAARAVDAGATLTMPPEDMFWGDRYCQLEDPFGHRWAVATHVRDVSPEEIHAAVQAMAG